MTTEGIRRLRFRLDTQGSIRFERFPGIVLRGALGSALYEYVCRHPQRAQCEGCPVYERCPYPRVFRPTAALHGLSLKRYRDLPPPWTLRPLFQMGEYPPGSTLRFEMTLLPPAWNRFPILISALRRAGAAGIGATRERTSEAGRFRLGSVAGLSAMGETEVYSSDGHRLRSRCDPWRFPEDFLFKPEDAEEEVTQLRIALRTPTLIPEGKVERGSLEFHTLASSFLRRCSLLGRAYGGVPPLSRSDYRSLTERARTISLSDRAVAWKTTSRYSSRQGREMEFGGWVGTLKYSGDVGPWVPFLRLAQLLHVGKHTAFGFGALEVAEPKTLRSDPPPSGSAASQKKGTS